MLMYPDHFQNWLVYGNGLFIFLILALFWLSETGQIWGFRAFPGERMEGMAWNFGRWCILTPFRTDKFMATVCRFNNFGAILTLWNESNLGFPGIIRRTHGGNGLKFSTLMYLDHLQNWLVYGHGLWIYLIWHYFDLVKRVKFGVSGHILENAWREWPEILYADVSWPPSELIGSGSWSVDFCNFGTILT